MPTETIREKILKNMQTTIEGITTGAGYNVTVETVERMRTAPIKKAALPGIFLYEEPETEAEPTQNGKVTRFMKVTAAYWRRSHENLSTAINELRGDVIKAMMADKCRGGHAMNTTLGDEIFFVGDEAGPLGGGEIDFRIKYRFKETDPSEP